MINQRKFRIGNILTHKGELSNIGHLQSNFCGISINGIGELGFDQFEPIPLTEAILVKCGFNEQAKSDWGIWNNGDAIYFNWGDENSLKIEYLHQLQNLHFLLMGKELEVIL